MSADDGPDGGDGPDGDDRDGEPDLDGGSGGPPLADQFLSFAGRRRP